MITLLLLEQIAQLFIMIFLGWVVVKTTHLKPEDSKILAEISLYLVMPCIIINAFQMERSPELLQQMTLSLGMAVLVHVVSFLLLLPCRKLWKLNNIEQASVYYSNAGNLVIPVVSAILGSEWVVFTSIFIIVQTVLMWTHGRVLISGQKQVSLKGLLCNVNVIAIIVGCVMFFMEIRLPSVVQGAAASVAVTIGPLCMFVTGMLLGGMNLKKLLSFRGIWRVTALRLVVFPAVMACIFRFAGFAALAPQGETILLITLLATATPTASSVTQIAQVYTPDAEYAGAISVMTTLFCIVTIPLIVMLYQM